MSSFSEQGEVGKSDSEFSVDLKTNKIKKKNRKKVARKNIITKITSSSYKKQKCLHFNKGNCTKGQACTFSHDFTPESSTTICKYFLSNHCSKGSQCNFLHSTQNYPCKFYHLQNKCNQKQMCKFSHQFVKTQFINDLLKENKDIVVGLWRDGKINFILDANLRNQAINFVKSELEQQNQTKKQPVPSFQSNLKRLDQKIAIQQNPYKSKPVDPRLKFKNIKTKIYGSNPQLLKQSIQVKKWIRIIPQEHIIKSNKQQLIGKQRYQKFLYSYY